MGDVPPKLVSHIGKKKQTDGRRFDGVFGPQATSHRLRPLCKKNDEEAAVGHRKKDVGGGDYLVPNHWRRMAAAATPSW
jgi:hypothetical protein